MGAGVFGDLVPWSDMPDVANGLMKTKDDGLMCTYEMVPYDFGCLSEAEQGAISRRINNTLKRLNTDEWGVWSHSRRVPSVHGAIPTWDHAEAALLDEEHRARLAAAPGLWTTVIRLTFWRRPPSTSQKLIRSLFFAEDPSLRAGASPFQVTFEADVSRTVAVLSSGCVRLDRLNGDALLTYLKPFVSIYEHEVKTPDVPVNLAYFLTRDCDFWHGTKPWIGTQEEPHQIRTIGISDDIPDELWAAMLKNLDRVPFAFDWVTRWLPMNREKADSLSTKKQINWRSKKTSFLAAFHERVTGQQTEVKNTYMEKQGDDAAAAQEELLSDESSLGAMSMVWMVRRRDAAVAERDILTLRTMIQQQGCICVDEDLAATEAYRACLPGNVTPYVRRHTLKSMNLAHLGPWHRPWGGVVRNEHLKGPALVQVVTEGCMPFGLDPYVGDLGHTLTIGPSGSGKSTLSAFMDYVQWMKYPGSQVIAWDVGGSWRCVTLFLRGVYYDLGSGQSPIQVLHEVDRDAEVPWIHDWLLARCHEKHVTITAKVDRVIRGILRKLREQRDLPRRMQSLLTLLDLQMTHTDERSNSKIDAEGKSRRDDRLDNLVDVIGDIRGALEVWTEGGKYGHLVDAPQDRLDWARVNTFEIRGLLDLPAAYPGVLEVIRHRSQKRMDGRPTRHPHGEAWEYVSNPAHLETLRVDIPNYRRDNVSLNLGTQAIEQLAGNPVTSLLMASCQTRLFLPNAQALSSFVQPGYEAMELHEEEIRVNIAGGIPKREAYFVRPDGRRLIDIELGPLATLVCGSNSKEAHAKMDVILEKSGPDAFPYEWLMAHGFHDAAARLLPSATMAADD
jgi:type IV secretion system protein VirB4